MRNNKKHAPETNRPGTEQGFEAGCQAGAGPELGPELEPDSARAFSGGQRVQVDPSGLSRPSRLPGLSGLSRRSGPSKLTQSFFRSAHLPWLELRTTCESTRPYAVHFHESLSLGLILGGRTRFTCGHEQHLAETGDLVFIAPGCAHSCNPVNGGSRSYHMLYLEAGWCLEQLARSGQSGRFGEQDEPAGPGGPGITVPRKLIREPESARRLSALIEHLLAEEASLPALPIQSLLPDWSDEPDGPGQQGRPDCPVRPGLPGRQSGGGEDSGAASELACFLGDLVRRFCVAATPEQAAEPYLRAVLPAAQERRKVGDLARFSGLSREGFSRIVKRRTGLAPSGYLHCLRLEAARRLLREGAGIAEADLAAGYADQSHFHRNFVKYFAATPRQYMARRRLRKG